MKKERYEIFDNTTGCRIPVQEFLLQERGRRIIADILRLINQDREQALRPDFLKAMVLKHPGNGGNGNKK